MSLLQEARNRIMAPIRAIQEKGQLREMDRRLLHEDLQRIVGGRKDDVLHRYVEILANKEFPNVPRLEVAASAMRILILQKEYDSLHQDNSFSRLRNSFDESQTPIVSILMDQVENDLRRGKVNVWRDYSDPINWVRINVGLGRKLAHAGY